MNGVGKNVLVINKNMFQYKCTKKSKLFGGVSMFAYKVTSGHLMH